MSEDSMLKCLIAFILGWLASRMMGNGFSVGGVESSPFTCSQGKNQECKNIADSRDCDEYYYIDHGGAAGQDRKLACTSNIFSSEKCAQALVEITPCPDNPQKKSVPSCLAKTRDGMRYKTLAYTTDDIGSSIPASDCSQVKLKAGLKLDDTCDHYYIKYKDGGYSTCSGDAPPGSDEKCKNDIPCNLPYTYCGEREGKGVCPDGSTKCDPSDVDSVCPGFPARPSLDCTADERMCPPKPGTTTPTYCPSDKKCKIWPLYPPK